MKTIFTWIVLFMAAVAVNGQNTIGLLSVDEEQIADGYNLLYPHNQSSTFLLNNCGEVVHEWDGEGYLPGNSAILTEDGLLYRSLSQGAASNEYIHAGGAGEGFEIRDWDNNLVWQWFYNDSTHRPHHDFSVLPNGNILFIAWERITAEEAIAAGRDGGQLEDGELWPETIIEVEPVGTDEGNIVWEWYAMDHLVQDFSSTLDNFGTVSEHPELIDMNFGGSSDDWLHFNALDYNETWDQIMISCPNFNEVWVIDHSTTTEQAAGHSGGFSGMGGDLLFRWGNPLAYGNGSSDDQKLFFQHDCHWMDIGLTNDDPNYDKIMVFNNRVGEDYSTVNIINPVFDSYYLGFEMADDVFLPTDFDWSYQRPDSTAMHSTGLSSVQRLVNGNTLICVGRFGYSFEITPDEEIVWEYKTPLSGGNPATQGDMLSISENLTFRMKRYPAEYSAFTGMEFPPIGYIELEPDTTFCSFSSSIDENGINVAEISVYPNPSSEDVTIDLTELSDQVFVKIFDVSGRMLYSELSMPFSNVTVDVSSWNAGLYLVSVDGIFVEKLLVNRP